MFLNDILLNLQDDKYEIPLNDESRELKKELIGL